MCPRHLSPSVVFPALFAALAAAVLAAAAWAEPRLVAGSLAPGERALFAVDIAEAQPLRVTLPRHDFATVLRLVGPGSDSAGRHDAGGSDPRIDLPRAASGTWFVAILNVGGEGGAFVLSVDGARTVTAVAAGEVPAGQIARLDAPRRAPDASALSPFGSIAGALVGRALPGPRAHIRSRRAPAAASDGGSDEAAATDDMASHDGPAEASVAAREDPVVATAEFHSAGDGLTADMASADLDAAPGEGVERISRETGDTPAPGTIETPHGRAMLPATALTPLFPWPPPRPSGWNVLPDDLFDLEPGAIYSAIDDALRSALAAVGHEDVGYYWIPDGFALVTRLERFEEDGSTVQDNSRWTPTVPAARVSFNIFDYFSALTTAQTGYFRVIVFAVTPQPFSTEPSERTLDVVSEWAAGGANTLPSAILARKVPPGTRVTALVYEFRKVRGAESATALNPSHMPVGEQLRRLGLIAAMRAEP